MLNKDVLGIEVATERHKAAYERYHAIESVHAADRLAAQAARQLAESASNQAVVYAAYMELAALHDAREKETLVKVAQAIEAQKASHPDADYPTLSGAPGRLPNGEWGVWVRGWGFVVGDEIRVCTRKGKRWMAVVTEIARVCRTKEGDPIALCYAERLVEDETIAA